MLGCLYFVRKKTCLSVCCFTDVKKRKIEKNVRPEDTLVAKLSYQFGFLKYIFINIRLRFLLTIEASSSMVYRKKNWAWAAQPGPAQLSPARRMPTLLRDVYLWDCTSTSDLHTVFTGGLVHSSYIAWWHSEIWPVWGALWQVAQAHATWRVSKLAAKL